MSYIFRWILYIFAITSKKRVLFQLLAGVFEQKTSDKKRPRQRCLNSEVNAEQIRTMELFYVNCENSCDICNNENATFRRLIDNFSYANSFLVNVYCGNIRYFIIFGLNNLFNYVFCSFKFVEYIREDAQEVFI